MSGGATATCRIIVLVGAYRATIFPALGPLIQVAPDQATTINAATAAVCADHGISCETLVAQIDRVGAVVRRQKL